MVIQKIESLECYLNIVENYGQKGCLSNDYIQREAEGLISQGLLFGFFSERNAFLLVKKDTCYRVYYYLNDLQDYHCFDEHDLVIEILYRGEATYPIGAVQYFERCGFRKNLVRDQYAGVFKDLNIGTFVSGVKIEQATSHEEVKTACELFNATFDKYSGDYISENEIDTLYKNNSIIVAKKMNGEFLGALHQTTENNVAWISHVAVLPNARGLGVGTGLMETFIQWNRVDDKTRYMLWVQRQNEAAVKMYQRAGFKFLNKSSLSMIKL